MGSPRSSASRPDFSPSWPRQYGVNALDARQLTSATIEARDELHRISVALRAEGGVWKNARLVATGTQIGVREARRIIHDRSTVTVDDLREGRPQLDAVCSASTSIRSTASRQGNRSRTGEGASLRHSRWCIDRPRRRGALSRRAAASAATSGRTPAIASPAMPSRWARLRVGWRRTPGGKAAFGR